MVLDPRGPIKGQNLLEIIGKPSTKFELKSLERIVDLHYQTSRKCDAGTMCFIVFLAYGYVRLVGSFKSCTSKCEVFRVLYIVF